MLLCYEFYFVISIPLYINTPGQLKLKQAKYSVE